VPCWRGRGRAAGCRDAQAERYGWPWRRGNGRKRLAARPGLPSGNGHGWLDLAVPMAVLPYLAEVT